jgi:NCAIR mutase (PurE)-related protein
MLSEQSVRCLLNAVAAGETSVEDAVSRLRNLPFEDLGFAKIDHHRDLRRGFPEVIYCAGKTPDQVAAIMSRLSDCAARVLGTRASPEHFETTRRAVPDARYDPVARTIWTDRDPDRAHIPGVVLVAAGTSDLPVAEEAAVTLDLMGHPAHRIYDVGVAGIQRVLAQVPTLRQANVVIVVAGMEGALPGVVAGLITAPVIAVPTSVGYGASFGGLAALLGMLNACSPGVAVVNIDNGYGAAHLAAAINTLARATSPSPRYSGERGRAAEGKGAEMQNHPHPNPLPAYRARGSDGSPAR